MVGIAGPAAAGRTAGAARATAGTDTTVGVEARPFGFERVVFFDRFFDFVMPAQAPTRATEMPRLASNPVPSTLKVHCPLASFSSSALDVSAKFSSRYR